MKNRMHNYKVILDYLTNTEKFKIVFLLTIILAVYGTLALGINEINVTDSLIVIFQFPFFNIILLSIILFNTITVCSTFSKEFDYYLIRKKSKKDALKEIIIFTIIYNIIYFIILYVMILSFCLIFKGKIISNKAYLNYSITSSVYIIFYLIRYIIITLLISILNVILYQKWREKIIWFNIFFIIGLIVYPVNAGAKSILNIIPWNYFTTSNYLTFINELTSSLLFAGFIEILVITGFHLLFKERI